MVEKRIYYQNNFDSMNINHGFMNINHGFMNVQFQTRFSDVNKTIVGQTFCIMGSMVPRRGYGVGPLIPSDLNTPKSHVKYLKNEIVTKLLVTDDSLNIVLTVMILAQ